VIEAIGVTEVTEATTIVEPRRPDRWAKKSRLQYAKERRERLVALLCDRDYEAHLGERLAAGEEPDARPGPGYGQCARCRRYLSFDRLEIDHVDGASWNKRAVNAWRRVARYWREFREGVRLRALCRGCNGGHLNNRRRAS
jgi:hypothetical protein